MDYDIDSGNWWWLFMTWNPHLKKSPPNAAKLEDDVDDDMGWQCLVATSDGDNDDDVIYW